MRCEAGHQFLVEAVSAVSETTVSAVSETKSAEVSNTVTESKRSSETVSGVTTMNTMREDGTVERSGVDQGGGMVNGGVQFGGHRHDGTVRGVVGGGCDGSVHQGSGVQEANMGGHCGSDGDQSGESLQMERRTVTNSGFNLANQAKLTMRNFILVKSGFGGFEQSAEEMQVRMRLMRCHDHLCALYTFLHRPSQSKCHLYRHSGIDQH